MDGQNRQRLDSINFERAEKLNLEAISARKELISTAFEYLATAYTMDIETYQRTGGRSGEIYVKHHQDAEALTNDAFGEHHHLSIRLVRNLEHIGDEIYVRIPVSEDFRQAFIEAGADPAVSSLEILKTTPIEAVYLQHIFHHPSGTHEVYKRITEFGSVEYSRLLEADEVQQKPTKRFFRSRRIFSRDRTISIAALESLGGQITPLVQTDLSYINNSREDIVNMTLIPQVDLRPLPKQH